MPSEMGSGARGSSQLLLVAAARIARTRETMRTKAITLVLVVAAMLAVSAGGIAAADGTGSDAVQSDDEPDDPAKGSEYDERLTSNESFELDVPPKSITYADDGLVTIDVSMDNRGENVEENGNGSASEESVKRLTAAKSLSTGISEENVTIVEESPRLTAEQSVELHTSEVNITIEEQYDQRLTADESFHSHIPAAGLEPQGNGIYRVNLTDGE
ncbi:hypothetical protein DMJ13_02995 [halophilic archaeon]|nr:hypothetical protein DMJ13_02995 [halophilic archaeon]